MKQINEAISVLRVKPKGIKASKKDLKPYYDFLKNLAPPENLTPKMLELLFVKAVRGKRFLNQPEEEIKLFQAKEIIREEVLRAQEKENERKAFQERVSQTIMSRVRRRAYYQLLSKEDQEIVDLQEQIKKIQVGEFFLRTLDKLYLLVKRATYIKRKPHVPVKVTQKGKKPYRRFILLTASIMVAILGGKYVWNQGLRAYQLRRSSKYPLVRT